MNKDKKFAEGTQYTSIQMKESKIIAKTTKMKRVKIKAQKIVTIIQMIICLMLKMKKFKSFR